MPKFYIRAGKRRAKTETSEIWVSYVLKTTQ